MIQRLSSKKITKALIFQEGRFIRIPWHLFWPSLYDLASMDKVMVEGAPESGPLVTQIVVRIPWFPLVQYQVQFLSYS